MNQQKRPLLLLIVIYLAFISLGLPDGILGVAWPSIRAELTLPLEAMGLITTTLLLLSAFSSFISGRVLVRLGTGRVTFISCVMTGLALLGYSLSPGLPWLLACTIPLGLGQGAVDSGLNRFVAEHYTARHMNWLHCFWGAGASVGPMAMTTALLLGSWRVGYRAVAVTQFLLAGCLLASLLAGLWKTAASNGGDDDSVPEGILSRVPDQLLAVLLFFLYTGIEFSMGTWLNSVLVESRAIPIPAAGLCVSLFYASIMAGRLLSGFLVERLGNQRMIRLGFLLAAAGAAVAGLSSGVTGAFTGTILLGMGLAPVYPCLMHETPRRFTPAASSRLIGYQVGTACLGGTLVCSGMGILLARVSLELLFPLAVGLILLAFAGNEILARRSRVRDA